MDIVDFTIIHISKSIGSQNFRKVRKRLFTGVRYPI